MTDLEMVRAELDALTAELAEEAELDQDRWEWVELRVEQLEAQLAELKGN